MAVAGPLREATTFAGLTYGREQTHFLGAVQNVGEGLRSVFLQMKPDELPGKLRAIPERPLRFRIEGIPGYKVVPYWQVNHESFNALPMFKP